MKHNRNKFLRIVGENKRPLSVEEKEIFPQEEGSARELELQILARRKKIRKRRVVILCAVALAAVALFLLVYLPTYNAVNVSATYPEIATQEGNYCEFAGGILKYTRDGISFCRENGKEYWNQSYQMKNPFLCTASKTAAVADRGGKDILVFTKEGIKGEIETTLPIEKISVSEQGIVCAILQDSEMPKIICYDNAGNMLVEHVSSWDGNGYPIDADISPDGTAMQVLYVSTAQGRLASKLAFYDFSRKDGDDSPGQIAAQVYEGTLFAEGFFLSNNRFAAVGDNKMVIYGGREDPKEEAAVSFDKEIRSVFHSGSYIGMVLKGEKDYELRLYTPEGKMKLSRILDGEYRNVRIYGGEVILFDGRRCVIYLANGIQRFCGEMNYDIEEICPVFGVNKYIVMTAGGMDIIRLVR